MCECILWTIFSISSVRHCVLVLFGSICTPALHTNVEFRRQYRIEPQIQIMMQLFTGKVIHQIVILPR